MSIQLSIIRPGFPAMAGMPLRFEMDGATADPPETQGGGGASAAAEPAEADMKDEETEISPTEC